MIINCDLCGVEFNKKPHRIKKSKHNFCSPECYRVWQVGKSKGQSEKIAVHCEVCEKEFSAYPSNIKRGWGRFCSLDCRTIQQTSKVVNACEICNREFMTKKGRKGARFCSIECTTQWRRGISGELNGNWKGGKSIMTCDNCGAEFEQYLSTRNGKHSFCSSECYFIWNQGENCYMWNGGTSFEPYPPEFNERLKKSIRERDGRACALCHTSGNHVHHVDYDKNNNEPINLITLCARCHAHTTNGNREEWTRQLSPTARNRCNEPIRPSINS